MTLIDSTIEQLYRDYHGPILRYLERLVASHETAEDLCQETFIKALRSWEQHDPSASACGWLYRIATNTAYDYFRRQRRIGFTTLSEREARRRPAPTSDACWDDVEPILAALSQIPDHERVPLLLHVCAGYRIREIAGALGANINTVKVRVHRARARFRQIYVA